MPLLSYLTNAEQEQAHVSKSQLKQYVKFFIGFYCLIWVKLADTKLIHTNDDQCAGSG
jgi:hypothetical protein